MVASSYVPDRGDIIWLDLVPQAGTEINNYRPCLVLTPKALNQRTKKCFIIPITRSAAKIPTQLPLPSSVDGVEGTLLVEQLKSLDYRARNARKITTLGDKELYQQIVSIVNALIIG